jgi:tRNA-uridine 2-sulfurtransferase
MHNLKSMAEKKKKVIVGLSGGLDSAVALLLLKKQGYQPIGLTLKFNSQQSRESVNQARKNCQKLKVPFKTLDCRQEFKKQVIDYFSKLLKQGKTPNPCIVCNPLVKFKALFNFASQQNCQYVATGHYARIKNGQLLRAKDENKDQSYFLCLMRQNQLKRIIFPLGNLTKQEVYQIAKKEKLGSVIQQKESQDLCFKLPKLAANPGTIVDSQKNILGRHQGLHEYTVGQRKGIKLSNGPWKVTGFDYKKNQLIVTNKKNDPLLSKKEIALTRTHFISGRPKQKSIKVKAKTRFNQPLASAKLSLSSAGPASRLIFDRPQKSVAPGQWAVFYLPRRSGAKTDDGEICLGGGMIK